MAHHVENWTMLPAKTYDNLKADSAHNRELESIIEDLGNLLDMREQTIDQQDSEIGSLQRRYNDAIGLASERWHTIVSQRLTIAKQKSDIDNIVEIANQNSEDCKKEYTTLERDMGNMAHTIYELNRTINAQQATTTRLKSANGELEREAQLKDNAIGSLYKTIVIQAKKLSDLRAHSCDEEIANGFWDFIQSYYERH